MKLYRLQFVQNLPIQIKEAWSFFSDPRNLPLITPPWLNLRITSEVPEKIYPGLIIIYRIKPLFGIPVTWVTEITHVNEPYYFVDEQRFGPYKFWHHQHIFRELKSGVEIQDIIHYALPFGPLGDMINTFIVKKRLCEIFTFRRLALERMLGRVEDGN
ncbi:MAG: SRPBCC family protein [Candidatus Jordarchaeaceae archaeon]|jgi:ligand-binding SRPBCC domain-containing protein